MAGHESSDIITIPTNQYGIKDWLQATSFEEA